MSMPESVDSKAIGKRVAQMSPELVSRPGSAPRMRLALAERCADGSLPGSGAHGGSAGEQDSSGEQASMGTRITVLLAVVVPFLGASGALVLLCRNGSSWLQLSLLLGMYTATMLGVTVGFHRLFTHRSFRTVRPIELLLGVLGSMAVQGPLLKWVAVHRRHHKCSDRQGDPHSPHTHGRGVLAMLGGFWHAHLGWLFEPDGSDLNRYVGDLVQDSSIRMISRLFPVWVALGLLLPTALGAMLTGTWQGAAQGFIWGGLARVFLVHHVAWSVNSICHLWGRRPFQSRDESRNNFIFGVLGLGEGWHNNHHAFPTSARHGLAWWQMDVTYVVIRLLATARLAWDVRVPLPEALARKAATSWRGQTESRCVLP